MSVAKITGKSFVLETESATLRFTQNDEWLKMAGEENPFTIFVEVSKGVADRRVSIETGLRLSQSQAHALREWLIMSKISPDC